MQYDVIIVGGGTAGCSAAYTLGKNGKKVLLIEKNIHLGGTMTSSFVSPMMKTSENQINTDFLNAFISALKKYDAQITYQDNIGWFNPELAKLALDDLMSEANVDVIFNSEITGVDISKRNINKIQIKSNLLSVSIEARYVIDATGNCDVGKLANCEFLDNQSQEQPTNLRFIMSGIDLKTFGKWLLDLDEDRNITTCYEINGETHLSTAYTWDVLKKWALKPLFDDAVINNVLKNEDRSYFQVFTIPGMPNSLNFNCPRIYFANEINPLDMISASNAVKLGRETIYRLANFCKQYFPGFENSYISNIADMLGIRVSRRIVGKYVYTIEDLKSGKKFDNPVVISNYPVDIHSNKANKSLLETVTKEYQLPVESLISKDIDNLFVVGRCLSADFYSQGALRIIPSCFSMGEGVAKYLLKNN